MNFFRITYLTEQHKQRRIIVENESKSMAIISAILSLPKDFIVTACRQLKPYEVKKLNLVEEKERHFSNCFFKITKPLELPKVIFQSI